MNKYFILIGITVLIIGGGIFYRTVLLSEADRPVETGVIRNFKIVADKDEWRWTPEVIEVDRGDRVKLEVVNEDEYDHGIAIDAFGVSQRMPANATINVEFVVTQVGDFQYYCSVPCGEGIVDGVKRTHFDMIGVIKVRPAVEPILTP
ncbi:MAG: cupredoxin domain-containing protein [Candidatus Taylorbacteria bacterium]|nr:cupredoxin domain-containing protein [Candidatus Taylorbacteria bacterium]